MVSVVRPPLTGGTARFERFQHYVVPVNDLPDENLIQHFAAADDFISAALAGGGAVLIHWCVCTGACLPACLSACCTG